MASAAASQRFVASLSCVVVDPPQADARGARVEEPLCLQVVWLCDEASGTQLSDVVDVTRVESGTSVSPSASCIHHELELSSGRGLACAPVEAQLSVHLRTSQGSPRGPPLGTAKLSVDPVGDGTPVVRHLTLEQCAPSLRRGTQLRLAVRVRPAGSDSPDDPWFAPNVPSGHEKLSMPCRAASAGSDSVASAESSDWAEGDQGGHQALPPVTSSPLHHDRRRGLARLFGKRRGRKSAAAAEAAANSDGSARPAGGPGATVSATSTWFFAGWLARGSGVTSPSAEGPTGCLSVGPWTADTESQEPEAPTAAAAPDGDAPSPPGSGRFGRGNLLRGFGGSRSGRAHHSRSKSAPAEAMAAPRSLLLGSDEDVFQQQLTQALAASSLATLPAHMRMKRRRPGRGSAHTSSAAALAPSSSQSGVATPSWAPFHEHKKVHSSDALQQPPGGVDGDDHDALHGDAPPSCPSSQPWLLTPLREGSLPCAGEWLHLELALPDGDPSAAFLAADVFFASIDQRSAEAGGSGACACTAVALASWLEAHPEELPVGRGGQELDDLIRDGSATWRELRACAATAAVFPDGHFDLDTALGQTRSRLQAVPGASFVAFMAPPAEALAKLEAGAAEALQGLLKGAPTLESALRSAHGEARPGRPATAVVSLLDHHSCVRLCSSGECVLVDTLGERLYEANTKAFLMRFSSLDDLVTFMQRIVAGPRLQALGPADLANGAHKLQCDVQVVTKTD